MTLRTVIAFALLIVLPAACAPTSRTLETAPDSTERAVETNFLAYKKALLSRDGLTGSNLVTAASLEHYRDMADEALTANRERLTAMNFVDRTTILLFRHGLSREQLRRMSGKELFIAAVERGWFSEDSLARTELADYRVDGDFADARVMRRDGSMSSVAMEFWREENGWRLDLLHNLEVGREAMALVMPMSGLSEDELLFQSLEKSTGRKPGPEIWSPPL